MSDSPLNTQTATPSPSNTIIAILSALLLVLWCLWMLVVYAVWRALFLPKLENFFMFFHRGCCRIFNLRCEQVGEVSTHRPTLFLANHVSYLDIFVLGGMIPGFFIAKSEVAHWPILGVLAKIQNTLFFERNSRRVKGQLQVMSQHFNKQGNLILFPEGTSTEGEHVQPFKSSLLQSVEAIDQAVVIQPVTIAYTHYQQQPMGSATRDYFAWYADMPFASHFFNALGMGKARVHVIFHKPVSLEDFSHRKECASHCQQQVANGLSTALTVK